MRRSVSLGLLAVLLVTAGCSGQLLDPDCSRSRGGLFSATVVESPPTNATVVESDRIPADATLVRETITSAVASNGSTTELNAAGVCRVRDALADLPRHDGDRSGVYVRHEGRVVRLQLAVYT